MNHCLLGGYPGDAFSFVFSSINVIFMSYIFYSCGSGFVSFMGDLNHSVDFLFLKLWLY